MSPSNPAEALLEALLPCPFCGDDAATNCDDGHWYIACNSLHCFCAVGEGYDGSAMPDHTFVSEDLAIIAWNRRATLTSPAPAGGELPVDALAQEIRRVDGSNTLGAGALAEALLPFVTAMTLTPPPSPDVAGVVSGPLKDSVALSASVESDRILQIHFNRPVTDADRAALINAHNTITTLSAERERLEADDPDEAYKLGLEEGYEKAVQEIDLLTGGDGEYCYCLGHASDRHCPDAAAMKTRIAERFETLSHTQQTEAPMDNAQIKHMVDRFLGWRFPENFNPDGGISFRRLGYEDKLYPMPIGTNLLDAAQAEAMVRFMIEGIPQSARTALTPKDKS